MILIPFPHTDAFLRSVADIFEKKSGKRRIAFSTWYQKSNFYFQYVTASMLSEVYRFDNFKNIVLGKRLTELRYSCNMVH